MTLPVAPGHIESQAPTKLERRFGINRVDRYGLGAAVLVLVAYLSTIRGGHTWGDDFAQYILHARNIAEGIPYGETGQIINSLRMIAPEMYPPVFPLLLTPAYLLFGYDLFAFKATCIVALVAALLVIYKLYLSVVKPPWALSGILLLALNPAVWEFKDEILSEFPFLFFVSLSIWAILSGDRYTVISKRSVLHFLVVGLLVYLAIGTRAAGIVLLPSLVLHQLLRRNVNRAGWILTLAACSISLILLFLQRSLLGENSASYTAQLASGASTVGNPEFIRAYLFELVSAWGGSRISLVDVALFVVSGVAMIVGFIHRSRQRITVIELFTVGYIVLVALWPTYQGVRLLLPLVPFLVFYILCSAGKLSVKPRRNGPRIVAGIFVALAISYAGYYRNASFDRVPGSLFTDDAVDLFRFVKAQPQQSIVAFPKPRALTLLTGRRATAIVCPQNREALSAFVRQTGADLFAINRNATPCLRKLERSLFAGSLVVYDNPSFIVYKL